MVDSLDRLRNSVAAVEGILLRHEMEPRAHSIAKRMSLLIARDEETRQRVEKVVRQIYWLHGQAKLTAPSLREMEAISLFAHYAHLALSSALSNVSSFSVKANFVRRWIV